MDDVPIGILVEELTLATAMGNYHISFLDGEEDI
jgi:hypothetical protein